MVGLPPITNGPPAHRNDRFGIKGRLGFSYPGRSLRRISRAGTPRMAASAAPASAPCRTSAFDQLVWPIGVSLEHTISYTAV
jgi:hypothetical protein